MFKKNSVPTAVALAFVAVLLAVGQASGQQGWPMNPPANSPSWPWNSQGYSGYNEPARTTEPATTEPAKSVVGKPKKYKLYATTLADDHKDEENYGVIGAYVPTDAKVWIDGKQLKVKGRHKFVKTKLIEPGKKHAHKVRVDWVEDGKMVSQTQTVSVRAKSISCVYLVKAGSKIDSETAAVKSSLAKLSPEDHKLAESQQYCAVQDGIRLGAMGKPVKVMVKGKPVFLCCKACRERAESNPDETLEKVRELKEKTAAAGSK